MWLFLVGLLNGIVTGLVYSIEEIWWCIFFCMVPFTGILLTKRKLSGFIVGYGMGYHATGLAFLVKLSSMLPLPRYTAYILMTAAILLASLILTFFMWLVFCIFTQRKKRTGADIFLVAGFYILAEWLQGMIPVFAFPWFRLGTVVTGNPIFLQGASLLGVLFVDFLIVLWNALLARIIISRKTESSSVAAVVVIVGVLLYGEVRLYEAESGVREQNLQMLAHSGAGQTGMAQRIMLVQGNHEGREKWGMEIEDILADYMQIIGEHIDEDIALIVMPETALPYAIEEDAETERWLLGICRGFETELLVGGIEKVGDAENAGGIGATGDSGKDRNRVSYNAVYHVTSEGIRQPAYRKQILVPFGEYLPFAELVERLCPWLMEFMTGNVFEAGNEEIVFDTKVGRIGTLICFESVFSEAAREAVDEGAQLLAIISNDAWFEGTPAMRQHHAHAVMRAVETNRYVLRAGNTGISSVIDNRGRIQVTMPENTRGVLRADLIFNMGENRYTDTIYSEVGDVLPVCFGVLLALGIIKRAGILIFSHLSAIIKR